MRFDFRCDGRELTRPTRRQSGWAAYAALLWAAKATTGTWPLRDDLRRELMFIAVGAPEYAAPVSSYLRAPRKGLPVLPTLRELPTLAEADAALVAWCEQLAGGKLPEPEHEEAGMTEADREAARRIDALTLSELNDLLARDDLSSWLLRKLATSSPVLAHLPRAASGRQMITLSYDENLFKPQLDVGKSMAARNGWLAYPYVNHAIYIGASSYHFEFIAPAGIDVVHSQLIEQPPGKEEWDTEFLWTIADTAASRQLTDGARGAWTETGQIEGSAAKEPASPVTDENEYEAGRPKSDCDPITGERIHLCRIDEPVVADALFAILELRGARTGIIGGATLAACAIAGLLVICAIATEPLVSHGLGASGLLLLFPGLMVAIVARAEGQAHAVTIRFLQGVRRTLLLSGVLAFVGAAMLTLIETGEGAHARMWHHAGFGVLAALAIWQAFKLLLARRSATARSNGRSSACASARRSGLWSRRAAGSARCSCG
jgi:hypothetical protein